MRGLHQTTTQCRRLINATFYQCFSQFFPYHQMHFQQRNGTGRAREMRTIVMILPPDGLHSFLRGSLATASLRPEIYQLCHAKEACRIHNSMGLVGSAMSIGKFAVRTRTKYVGQSNTGMGKLRPAGHMWPAKNLYQAKTLPLFSFSNRLIPYKLFINM